MCTLNNFCSVSDFSEYIVLGLGETLGSGYPILYNAIGIISIFLQIMIFQMRSKKQIVFVGITSNIGWLSYFVLQGDFISSTSSIIGIMSKIIILLSVKHDWANSKFWNVFFLLTAGVFSLFTFKTTIDIFALLASMSSILAFFMTKENTIRKVSLFSYCMFACNSLSKQYTVALVADITALISVIVALIRYRKDEEKSRSLPTEDEE